MNQTRPPNVDPRGRLPQDHGTHSTVVKFVAFAGGLLAGLLPWALIIPSNGDTSANSVLTPPVIGSIVGIMVGLACLYPRRTRWFGLGLLLMLVVINPLILSVILNG